MTIIQHGTLVLPDGLMQGDIAFENGVITRIAPPPQARPPAPGGGAAGVGGGGGAGGGVTAGGGLASGVAEGLGSTVSSVSGVGVEVGATVLAMSPISSAGAHGSSASLPQAARQSSMTAMRRREVILLDILSLSFSGYDLSKRLYHK